MYLRWQHRKAGRATPRQRPLGLAIGAQEPAARDLALEVKAVAITKSLSRHLRRSNTRFRRPREPRTSLVAVIVRSERVTGRPRQRLIR